MRKVAVFGLTLLLAGCHPQLRGNVIRVTRANPYPANLALGPTEEDSRLAQLFSERSAWPCAAGGFRLDETAEYFKTSYDYQSAFDRFGGVLYELESIESGTFLR